MTQDVPVEPVPDPVPESLRLRASDADRDRVADVLRESYAEGRLTPAEHEERLTAVYAATTIGDLVPILSDLPVPPGTLAVPTSSGIAMPTGNATVAAGSSPAAAQSGPIVAVFGEFERAGAWTVPAELTAVCVFGGGKLNFTEAVLTGQETILTAVCLFGELELTIPEGMAVRGDAVALLGSQTLPPGLATANGPTLVIRGAAILGEIKVVRAPRPPVQQVGQ